MLLGQSLGCRREADRSQALTADDLIGRTVDVLRFYSDASTEDRPAALTAKGLKSAVVYSASSRMSRERTARKSLSLEGNLPQRKQERSARMAGRHLPEAPNFAEGLTALHGIEAVPEWR